MQVLAEGVETTEQLEFLRSEACDQYQGFLYSKAVTASQFSAILLKSRLSNANADALENQAHQVKESASML